MPQVQPASFLTLHYRMSGPQGQTIINTFGGQPATLTLGAGELSPAIEQRLIGLEEGSRQVIDLPPGEAFGERQPEMLQWVARKELSDLGDPNEQYKPWAMWCSSPRPMAWAALPDRCWRCAKDGAVLFDFNHPLAGQPVRLKCR